MRAIAFEVDGASLLRELLSSTPAGQLAASGTGYFGRFDGSVLDHLRLRLCEATQALASGLADE